MRIVVLTLFVAAVSAFAPSPFTRKSSDTALQAISRKDFLNAAIGAATATIAIPAAFADETLPNGVKVSVVKSGDGPKPEIGELVAIRFNAAVEGSNNLLDDIFGTPEPYYTRVGSGGLIKVSSFRMSCGFLVTLAALAHPTLVCYSSGCGRGPSKDASGRSLDFDHSWKSCFWSQGKTCECWKAPYSGRCHHYL
jgi:hypothetical protein